MIQTARSAAITTRSVSSCQKRRMSPRIMAATCPKARASASLMLRAASTEHTAQRLRPADPDRLALALELGREAGVADDFVEIPDRLVLRAGLRQQLGELHAGARILVKREHLAPGRHGRVGLAGGGL